MKKIGIECESIEDQMWGVGRIVDKLLENIASKPELATEFKFFLYFKNRIPQKSYLDNPIFIKKIIGTGSFSLYYFIFLPIKLWFEKLDMMFFPNYMLPVLFRGKSLVILTEDIDYEIKRGSLPFRYKLAYKIFAGWAAKHATRIMAISETSKKEISGLFRISPERIVINQLGVDPAPLISATEPKKENYILYVGQAFPRRHLRETMLAFEKLAPQYENLKLIAIGKDKYEPPVIGDLKNSINKRLGGEKIIYKEYVPENELHQYYADAKLLIYISSKEAFGLPPLEALSHGTPSVIAEKAVAREIFGNHAFFVTDPDDPASIASAITEGLNNESKRQEIKNAQTDILKKYTWTEHMNRFLQIARNF